MSNGLTNTDVHSLAINANGVVFAGTWGGGVYSSSNNGASWTQGDLTNRNVLSLAINSSGVVFAGTYGTYGDGIYSSSNNEGSWTQVNNGLIIKNVYSLAINSSGVIFAGTSFGGFYSSSNNGASWTQASSGLLSTYVESLVINSSGVIFAGTYGGGVFRSKLALNTKPTLSSPTNTATSQSVTPTLSWASVVGAASYRVEVSTVSNFATTVIDESGITSTSYAIPSGKLSGGNTYYWRIRAVNSGVETVPSDAYSFTTLAAPTAPTAPTLSSPNTEQVFQSSSLSMTWGAVSNATGYELHLAKDVGFSNLVVGNALSATSYTASGLSVHQAYYWRVRSTNAAGAGAWSEVRKFYIYPASLAISSTKSFGAVTQSSSYRMVSVPSDGVSLSVSGTQNTDWGCYTTPFNGADYASCGSTFEAGKGVWLVSKNGWSISTSKAPVALSTDRTYSIPLTSGWNIIANPFDQNVTWESIRALNGVAVGRTIKGYDGSGFTSNATLVPYEAYLFNNDIGLSTLKVPYPFLGASAQAESLSKTAETPLSVSWLTATTQNARARLQVGFHEAAHSGLDAFDDYAPPSGFALLDLYSQLPQISPLSQDIRAARSEGERYELVLTTKEKATVRLEMAALAGLGMREALLVDQATQRHYALSEHTPVWLQANEGKRHLTLYVGNRAYIAAQRLENLPKSIQLESNYPNPFNPETRIVFGLPEASAVRLTVYDVLGREVRTLQQGNVAAGWHELVWDGRDAFGRVMATGLYVYRLEAQGKALTKTMVLVK